MVPQFAPGLLSSLNVAVAASHAFFWACVGPGAGAGAAVDGDRDGAAWIRTAGAAGVGCGVAVTGVYEEESPP